jgi:hypothetical protein
VTKNFLEMKREVQAAHAHAWRLDREFQRALSDWKAKTGYSAVPRQYFKEDGSPTLGYRLRCIPFRLGLRKVAVFYVAPNHRFHYTRGLSFTSESVW